MKSYTFFKLFLLGLVLGLAGCSSLLAPSIDYDLDDIKESPNKQLSGITLDIKPFEDIRKSVPENAILYPTGEPGDYYYEVGEKRYCVNKEERYYKAKGDVPLQISKAIGRHLNKRGTYKTVTVNNERIRDEERDEASKGKAKKDGEVAGDYYLTGKLKRFYGQQEFTSAPKVASLIFGFIGSLATMGVETPLKVEIEITDLAIYKNDGQLLAEIGDIHETFAEPATGGGNCRNLFRHVNLKLKIIIEKLAEKIENIMANKISL